MGLILDSVEVLASLAVALLAVIIAALAPYTWASLRPRNFPPGPRALPLVGNLHLIPKSKAFVLFHQWTKKYGPIIGLKFGPTNVVILDDWRDVEQLLEKRGHLYSSRPSNYIANQLICPDDTHILFAPYGNTWKAQRKAAQGLLTPRELAGIVPIQQAEAVQTAYDMVRDPGRCYEHIERYTTAVILASVFGQRGESFDSPNIQALYDVQNRFTALLEPGAAPPVDGITFLRHIPEFLAPWKRKAKQIRRDQSALYSRLYNETKARMQRGVRTGCFMEKLIDEQVQNKLDDEHTIYLGGILMEAGSDTTSSTLNSFLLGMLENPGALKSAQDEVDRVCGTERSPTMADLDHLPYIEACMHEVLRWRPVAAGGIPHMLMQTDTYKGYVFPAGTIFFANTWAIHNNESEYDDPACFRPERWLGGNKYGTKADIQLAPGEQRKSSYGWGVGRRICSGQKMAEASIKINIAKIVWGFDLEEVPGHPPDVSIETGYAGGFVIHPKKFPIRMTPRSEQRADVLQREFEALRGFYEGLSA
ncbi:cytochrome P450 [Aspergillus mulundensis]|uniref:Putative Cytochrome P450 n=1 Tax=Aspergillus mulundensis TaxID=1810919 RepID=A0A3D8R4E9_9EURO|nr:putative Cytochrome P450 [Aspergillus mulundensis]RDW68694.1 putative Cytochrome P450 [Aspergillus mulundensis]